MSQEIELKLALADAGPHDMHEHPMILGQVPRVAWLRNTYYDTPEADLERARVALRIRRTPTQLLQTLKTSGEGHGGLSVRGEWEWPIEEETLDRQGLAALEPMRDLPRDLLDRLEPRFVTDFERQAWDLSVAGSHIELALDLGEIRAGERRAPIRELELELKSGDHDALWQLAERLAEWLPLRPAGASKAARGSALLAGHWPLPPAGDRPAEHLERVLLALDAHADSNDEHFRDDARQALLELSRQVAAARDDALRAATQTLLDSLTRQAWFDRTFGQALLSLCRLLRQPINREVQ